MESNDSPFYIKPTYLFITLSVMNLLNFIDRGIIPGSTNEFNQFIENDLDTNTPDVYLGLLQSSFIVGLLIGMISFGHLIHFYGRFYLVAIGCSLWILAVFLSGISQAVESYIFLAFARMLSGAGEASLQVVVSPLIQEMAPEEQRGKWLSVFYTAIPVGTALGYAYSSLLAGSVGWQWAFYIEGLLMIPFVFYTLAVAPYFPAVSESEKGKSGGLLDQQISRRSSEGSEVSPFSTAEKHVNLSLRKVKPRDEEVDSKITVLTNVINEDLCVIEHKPNKPPTLGEELFAIVRRPVFLCLSAAYAAETFMLIGLSTFGSAFIIGLGFFDNEAESSAVFGVVVSVSGVVSTPLGGFLLDRLLYPKPSRNFTERFSSNPQTVKTKDALKISWMPVQNDEDNKSDNHIDSPFLKNVIGERENDSLGWDDKRSSTILPGEIDINTDDTESSLGDYDSYQKQVVENLKRKAQLHQIIKMLFTCSIIATILLSLLYFAENVVIFMILVIIGCGMLFLCNPAINMAGMLAVPEENRPIGVALMSVASHALGDVPSPIIAGWMKDMLAPGCISSDDENEANAAASDSCRADASGLRLCILILSLWLIWMIVFFALASYFNRNHDEFSCSFIANMCSCKEILDIEKEEKKKKYVGIGSADDKTNPSLLNSIIRSKEALRRYSRENSLGTASLQEDLVAAYIKTDLINEPLLELNEGKMEFEI